MAQARYLRATWMFDRAGKCIMFSESWLKFRGRRLQEELGDGWLDGVHAADKFRCISLYRSAIEARQPFQTEFRVSRAEGGYSRITAHGVPIYLDNGRFLGYSGELQEIKYRVSRRGHVLLSRPKSLDTARRVLKDIAVQSQSITGVPAISRGGKRALPIPVSGLLGCLDLCTNPFIILDKSDRALFYNTAFATLAAGAISASDYPTSAQEVEAWLDSNALRDLQDIHIAARQLGNKFTGFAITYIGTRRKITTHKRVFLHHFSNTAAALKLLLDLFEQSASESERQECITLLQARISQLLFEVQNTQASLDEAALRSRGTRPEYRKNVASRARKAQVPPRSSSR